MKPDWKDEHESARIGLKAFYVDEMLTIFAASSIDEAKNLWEDMHGEEISKGYPCELDDYDLDVARPDFDDNGEPTGKMTTIRSWIEEKSEAGWLCGTD